MKKYILLLFLLVLPNAISAQSFEGSYKAQFKGDASIAQAVAEFEVQTGGAVRGRLSFGNVSKAIKGQVDYNGILEAKSERFDNTIYTLKADLSRSGGKITLYSRFEEMTAGRRKFSQSMTQGTYSRIEKRSSRKHPSLPSS